MIYNREYANFQAGRAPVSPEDPSTVKGLLAFCRRWLSGEIAASELHNPCWEMAARLRAAAEATFRDLDHNPELSDETLEPVLASGESYEAIAEILDELPRLAAESRRDEFLEALEDFDHERMAVLEATEEIHDQMSGQERRCPRCGDVGEGERCPHCRLVLLYPDSAQMRDYSPRSANLSPLHLAVYQAYSAVLAGESSLERLLDSLPPLSAHLRELSRFCDVCEDDDLAYDLRADIEVSSGGLERLSGVARTYLASDLRQGWEDVFEAAVSAQKSLRRAGEQNGMVEEEPPEVSDGMQWSGGR